MDHYHITRELIIIMSQTLSLHKHTFAYLFGTMFQIVKKPKVLLIALIALVIFAGLFWFMNTYIRPFFASIYTVDMTFTPSKETVQVGEEFTINVQVSGEIVSAADLHIEYTKDVVKYPAETNMALSGFSQIADNPYFSPPIIELVSNGTSGQKLLNMVVVSEQADKDTVQFGLRFRADQEGDAIVTLITQDSKLSGTVEQGIASYIDLPATSVTATVHVVGVGSATPTPTGDLVPTHTHTPTPPDDTDPTVTPTVDPSVSPSITPSISPTITITPTESLMPSPSPTNRAPTNTATPVPTTGAQNPNVTLDMKVRLQGVVTQPKEVYREQPMKVLLLSTDKSFRAEQAISFTVNGDAIWVGSMKIANVPTKKKFNVYVKGTKHLQRKICTLAPTETVPGQYDCSSGQITLKEGTNVVDMSKIFVLAGDIPIQNGIVDSVDIIYVRKNLGVTSPAVLSRADFNLDGIVDTQDYTLAVTALGFKYDEK